MATAVRNASSQALCPDSAMKEGERNPLLLQLQVCFALWGMHKLAEPLNALMHITLTSNQWNDSDADLMVV